MNDNLIRFDWAMKRLLRDKSNYDVLEAAEETYKGLLGDVVEIYDENGLREIAADGNYRLMSDIELKIPTEITTDWYQSKPVYEKMKRVSDVILSLILLVILAGPMLGIALAIRLDSPGPVFYRQIRLGTLGKPFTLLKFRTMRKDAERNGPVWTEKEDARRTKVGVFLRRFHLDELPQLVNILAGDMSLVGPRPERAVFYEKFRESVSDFEKRLLIKPGLTGLAQIEGKYNTSPKDKAILDLLYIENFSLPYDFKLMLRTLTVFFRRDSTEGFEDKPVDCPQMRVEPRPISLAGPASGGRGKKAGSHRGKGKQPLRTAL